MARRKNDNWDERQIVRHSMRIPLARGRSDLAILDLAPDVLDCAASMVSSYCNYSANQSATREQAATTRHGMDVELQKEEIQARKEQELAEIESKVKMSKIQSDAAIKQTQIRAEADIKMEEIRATTEVKLSEIQLQNKQLEEKIAELQIRKLQLEVPNRTVRY